MIICTEICIVVLILIYIVKNLFYHYWCANKHKNYISLFIHFSDLAYDSVYKDQLLGFLSQAVNPSPDLLETIKRNYVKLSLDLMGKEILNVLSKFYGGETKVVQHLLVYFQQRIDTDELMQMMKNRTRKDDVNDTN